MARLPTRVLDTGRTQIHFKAGVSLSEIERRSGFSRKKVTRICRDGAPVLLRKMTAGRGRPRTVAVVHKVSGEGAIDILRSRITNVFDCGSLA